MKRTELAKMKGLKVDEKIKNTATPGRFGKEAAEVPDRREQRKIDQAQGLVPFAVKLNGDLIKQIQTLAQTEGKGLNEVVAELLRKGLSG